MKSAIDAAYADQPGIYGPIDACMMVPRDHGRFAGWPTGCVQRILQDGVPPEQAKADVLGWHRNKRAALQAEYDRLIGMCDAVIERLESLKAPSDA